MATGKKLPSKRRSSASKPRASSNAVRIHVELTDETSSYYVNHLEVGYSAYEFALNAAKAPTVLSREARAIAQSTGELVLNPELQLVFPPRTAKALAAILGKQVAAYEARFGEILQEGGSNE